MIPIRRLSIAFSAMLVLSLALAPAALAAPLRQSGVTHVVTAGETLTSIAARYGVSLQAIMQANDIANPSLIRTGQRLVIPGASVATAPAASGSVHIVAAGETLSGIAAQYGVSMDALVAANALANPSAIRAGQQLIIPSDRQAAPAVVQAASSTTYYVVQPGDNLAQIAQRYGATVASIAYANNISNPSQIVAGQTLVIPSSSSTPLVQPAAQGNLSVVVSISQQHCWVYQGEALLYSWPCSTGRPGSGTKTGTFYVQSKIREAWGSRWGFYMPYWLGIYWAGGSENGIHGLPYEPGGSPIWANAVGSPVTFGCVLLGAWESKTLWDMAYIGMPVTIKP